VPAKVDDENALFNYSDESTTFSGTRSTPSRMPQQVCSSSLDKKLDNDVENIFLANI